MMQDGFHYRVRARYVDVDKMGVVYHSRYLEWFEAARTELLRFHGLPYVEIEKKGVLLPVVEAHLKYRQAVLYDEEVIIQPQLTECDRAKLRLEYSLWMEGEKHPRITGYTIHSYMGSTGRAIRAPKEILTFLEGCRETDKPPSKK